MNLQSAIGNLLKQVGGCDLQMNLQSAIENLLKQVGERDFQPMRILMIGPVPRIYGGISAVVGSILDSDLPRRHELIYLAEGTREGKAAKLRRFLTTLPRAAALLLSGKVDLLHQQVGDGSSFYRHMLYLALGRLARLPVLFHWHLPGDASAATSFYQAGGPVRRRLVRWALNAASRVIVLSPAWQPALSAIAPAAQVVALLNPVDCAAIRPGEAFPARSQPLLLFLGDFSIRKGVRDLLKAAPAVLARHPTARFLLCGGQPPADVLALAEPLGAAVEFPGFVRGQDKLHLLQSATLLVLPSYAEGVPIAVLEGMAAGLPIVTTPVGGLPDIFQHGRNGLLVPSGDLDALADAINRLLDDPDLRRRTGAHNRQQALADFDVPVYVEKLNALYESVMREA